jgi:plasmid replication initiation protein
MSVKIEKKITAKGRLGNGVICEANQIIESYHQLNETEIKLLQLCLAPIYQVEAIDRDKYYEVELDKYAEMYGLSKNAAYNTLVDACKTLMTRTITLKTTLLDSEAHEKSKTIIHWVHSCRYNSDTSSVEIKWHDSILHLLCQFGEEMPYSKYCLDDVRKLKSIHAIRLYRILNRWANLKTKKYTIEEFKEVMGFSEMEYQTFKNLRSKVIDPAIEAINLYTNLFTSVSFKTSGNRKTHVIFTIAKTNLKQEEVI